MARPRWQRLTITTVKSAVTLVVLWAVGRHVLAHLERPARPQPVVPIRAGLADRVGTALLGGPLGLRSVLRADSSSQSDAGAGCSRHCEPIW